MFPDSHVLYMCASVDESLNLLSSTLHRKYAYRYCTRCVRCCCLDSNALSTDIRHIACSNNNSNHNHKITVYFCEQKWHSIWYASLHPLATSVCVWNMWINEYTIWIYYIYIYGIRAYRYHFIIAVSFLHMNSSVRCFWFVGLFVLIISIFTRYWSSRYTLIKTENHTEREKNAQ